MGRRISALFVLLTLVAALSAGVVSAGTVKINFQLRGAEIPAGYYPDYGQAFGLQDNGLSYGWSRNIEADARHRNNASAKDQRYDTFVHLQKGAAATWEIELPNGTYNLFLVVGETDNADMTQHFDVEGVIAQDLDGRTNFDEYNLTVTVADGRLTIKPGPGAVNTKIAFVDISSDALDVQALIGKAKNPSPANGAQGVTMALFTWKAGPTAALHNMYLGLTPELGAADLVLSLSSAAVYYHTAGLTPGATYYWRVDEIEGDMVTIRTGDVWSFSVPSVTAYKPSPADGVKWVFPDAGLTWQIGKDAVSHDVYFGTDKAAVESGAASAFQKNVYVLTWQPPLLQPNTTYYWRVDEVGAGGTKAAGSVWSFTTLPEVPITDPSLLVWYKMDEEAGSTLVDWSGHGRHAKFGAVAPVWTLGHFGGALEFAGTGASAVCADGTFGNGLDAITITVWIKSDVTNTDKGFINFMIPSGNDDRDIRYDAAGGNGGGTNVMKMGLAVATDATTTTILQLESSNDSQTTEWQHVALTWKSGESLKFYINGSLDAPTDNRAPATGTLTGFTNITVGKGAKDNSDTASWDGLIDEIRVYNKALSQEEVQLVMRGDVMLAWDPSPSSGAITDELQVLPLTWQAGDKASQHDVYFGMDRAAVAEANATDATGIYRGRQRTTSFSPAEQLVWDKQHFWRVDEVNNDGTISAGFVWSFTLTDFLTVDDFESYSDTSPNRVFQTWVDGFGFSEDEFFPQGNPGNGSSSAVGHDIWTAGTPYTTIIETGIVHAGGSKQSMPVDYNNAESPYYSETDRTWTSPRNWKLGGVTDLSLWFQGYPQGWVQTADGMTINSAGADIFGMADEFRFVYKRLTGNGSIIAKVESLDRTSDWTKAGVMIRDSLDAGSRFAAVYITPDYGCRFQARSMTSLDATSDSSVVTPEQTAIQAPYWVKLERTGDDFKGYYSADGVTWTPMAWNPQTITLAANTVYVGLAVTSHNTDPKVVTTAVFSNISTSASATGAWQMAEIGLDSPDNSPQDLFLTIQDSGGKSFTVAYPAGTNVGTWTEWKVPLSQFTGVNMGAVKKMVLAVGDKKAPKADGAGTLFFDDICLLRPAP